MIDETGVKASLLASATSLAEGRLRGCIGRAETHRGIGHRGAWDCRVPGSNGCLCACWIPPRECKERVSGSLMHTNALNKHRDEGRGAEGEPAGVFAGNCALVFTNFSKTLPWAFASLACHTLAETGFLLHSPSSHPLAGLFLVRCWQNVTSWWLLLQGKDRRFYIS